MSKRTRTDEAELPALVDVPTGETALDVFKAADTTAADAILADLRKHVDAFQVLGHDVTTDEGREAIRAFAYAVTRSKTAIEAAGKAVADDVKQLPKLVDANRRHFKSTIEAWHSEVRKPLDDWEEAEAQRVGAIKAALGELQAIIVDTGHHSAEFLRDRLEHVLELSEVNFGEYVNAAAELVATATETLQAGISRAEKAEADAAELDRLRKIQAERDREDRERKIAEDAAAKAKADAAASVAAAEKAKADAEKRAADAEKDAAEREARAAAKAAAKAKADAEAETARLEAEQKARDADLANRGRVNRAALAALVEGGVDVEAAKLALTLIANGKIPAVSICY